MSWGEGGRESEPVLWRLLEGLAVNLLVVAAIIVAIVLYVWDGVKGWFGRGE